MIITESRLRFVGGFLFFARMKEIGKQDWICKHQPSTNKQRSIVEKAHSISVEGIAPYAADVIGVTNDMLLEFIG